MLPARQPIACYAARTKDDAVLRLSSSGGVFSELAKVVLRRGGVVVAAGFEPASMNVAHRCVESEADIELLRGSKYVTSDLAPIFSPLAEHVKNGREVLFVGTPCQVAVIRKIHGDVTNLVLCAIACHSNIPAFFWRKYLGEVSEKAGSSLVGVSFRDKRNGWRDSTLCLDFADPAKSIVEPLYGSLYWKLFYSGWATHAACFNCAFRAGRSGADLMIGDFWGIEDVAPALDDGKGVSAVLVYTDVGASLFAAAEVSRQAVAYEEVIAKNPYIATSPTVDTVKRGRFQRVCRSRSLSRSMRYAEWGPLPQELLLRPYAAFRHQVGAALRKAGLR